MRRAFYKRGLAVLCCAGWLAACSLLPQKHPIDQDRLDAALNSRIGGASTCVVLEDLKTGTIVYQFGAEDVCMAQRPPCDTFDIPAALIGLDSGVITATSTYKWDGSPQPVAAWQADADLARAYRDGIGWWWGDLNQAVGHDRLAEAVKRFDYGNKLVDGPERSFWLGPRNGGALAISTRQQAGFLRRFYSRQLGVKAQTSALVQDLLVDEVSEDTKLGKATISGAPGSCPITADGARGVSWWVGRLQTRDRDLTFAASLTGEGVPPGLEVAQRLKDSFAAAGLLPAS